MYITWVILIIICVILLVVGPLVSRNQLFAAQGVPITPMISDGQFVWGPNVGTFEVYSFLENLDSPLLPYADDITVWAAYTSINPRVLLTVLELRNQWISNFPDGWTESEILAPMSRRLRMSRPYLSAPRK